VRVDRPTHRIIPVLSEKETRDHLLTALRFKLHEAILSQTSSPVLDTGLAILTKIAWLGRASINQEAEIMDAMRCPGPGTMRTPT
jgi:hypothetical protein